jgi:hypothetical protein
LGPLAFVAPRVIAATVDGSVAGYGTVTGLPQRLPDPCDEQEKAKSVVPRLRGADAVSAAPAILKDLRFSGYQRAIGIYSHLKLMSLSWNNRRDLLVRLERGLVYQWLGRGEYHDGGEISESE